MIVKEGVNKVVVIARDSARIAQPPLHPHIRIGDKVYPNAGRGKQDEWTFHGDFWTFASGQGYLLLEPIPPKARYGRFMGRNFLGRALAVGDVWPRYYYDLSLAMRELADYARMNT